MSTAAVTTVVSVVSAVVAVLAAVFGYVQRDRAMQEQRRQFEAEFAAERQRQVVQLRKDFLLEQYRYRLTCYAEVLQSLGAVSYIEGQSLQDLARDLAGRKDELRSVSEQLSGHLYGKAGLLMSMKTRGMVHWARVVCLQFLASRDSDPDISDLVDAFYDARRYLRADLELLDDRSEERLNDLADQLGPAPRVTDDAGAVAHRPTGPMPASPRTG